MALRRCGDADASALALVGQATFLETFAGILDGTDILEHCARQHVPDVYIAWTGQAETRIWIAEALPGRAPVGYLVLTQPELPIADLRADDLEVKRIYLLQRFHGGGVGSQLLSKAIEHAKSVGCRRLLLGVFAHNANALAFYERNGFVRVAERKFKVGATDHDDLILALEIGRGATGRDERAS